VVTAKLICKSDMHFWKSLLLKRLKWPVYQSICTQLWVSQVDGTLPGDKVVGFCNPWPFCVPHIYPVSLNKGLKRVRFAQHWLWTYLKQNVRICLFWTMPLDWTQSVTYRYVQSQAAQCTWSTHHHQYKCISLFWLVPPSWVFVSPSFPWLTYVSPASWNVFVH